MKSLKTSKKTKGLLISILFSTGMIHAQNLLVDYYGVVSSSSNTNMLKMAQDLFFTQLKSIDGITVDDKRPDLSKTLTQAPSIENSNEKISFYAEISEEKNSEGLTSWNCRFNAVTNSDGLTRSKNEIFESYYKILVNAKLTIEQVLGDFKKNGDGSKQSEKQALSASAVPNIDIEYLAGTWTGEPYTDKIIILRGGRGFVVFKNGATMNVAISAKKLADNSPVTVIEIKQVGKSNASFFPELPREEALKLASTASPITWNFILKSQNQLEGSKFTLLQSNSGIENGVLKTSWFRN